MPWTVVFGHTITSELPLDHLGSVAKFFDDPGDVWVRGDLIGIAKRHGRSIRSRDRGEDLREVLVDGAVGSRGHTARVVRA